MLMEAQKSISQSRSGPLRKTLGATATESPKASLARPKKAYATPASSRLLVHTHPSRPAFQAACAHFAVPAYHLESVSVSWDRSNPKCRPAR
jgi:hypothetical protein